MTLSLKRTTFMHSAISDRNEDHQGKSCILDAHEGNKEEQKEIRAKKVVVDVRVVLYGVTNTHNTDKHLLQSP